MPFTDQFDADDVPASWLQEGDQFILFDRPFVVMQPPLAPKGEEFMTIRAREWNMENGHPTTNEAVITISVYSRVTTYHRTLNQKD